MTQGLTWNQLKFLDVGHEVRAMRQQTKSLLSLLSGDAFHSEVAILRSIVFKITVRLRCARVSVILNQVAKRVHQYMSLDVRRLLTATTTLIFTERLDPRTGNVLLPDAASLEQLLRLLSQSGCILRQIIDYSILSFGNSLMWLRHNHLVQHFLPAISAVSRISVIAKSLLCHSCDVYHSLHRFVLKLNPSLGKSLPPSIATESEQTVVDAHSKAIASLIPGLLDVDAGVVVPRPVIVTNEVRKAVPVVGPIARTDDVILEAKITGTIISQAEGRHEPGVTGQTITAGKVEPDYFPSVIPQSSGQKSETRLIVTEEKAGKEEQQVGHKVNAKPLSKQSAQARHRLRRRLKGRPIASSKHKRLLRIRRAIKSHRAFLSR